jgi:hypothetical protein
MLTAHKGGVHMKYFSLVIGVLLLAGIAFGADVDGKWTGTITGMDMTIGFTFKAEGKTLTGVHIINGTETPIKDGKIDGNNISFSVSFDMGGQEMKMEFKGVLSGDNLKLSMDMMGQPMDINLKRAK